MTEGALNIALLCYRGHPHIGGQGVYARQLSAALTDIGHRVVVFSGQPYPDLEDDVQLVKVAGLDLYRADDPFRRPARSEFRDWVDVLEYGLMCTASFPEPLTFSLRALKAVARHPIAFDLVHDNQSLGYGLLAMRRGSPVIATVHHPVTVDRRIDLQRAESSLRRLSLRRWYSFARMQARVAPRLDRVITVSDSAKRDVIGELHVPADRVGVVPNGVDASLFRPLDHVTREPGTLICVLSSDLPLKGFSSLAEAVAKLLTEREVRLIVVGNGGTTRTARRTAERYGIERNVQFTGSVDALQLVELYARADVAVVPSLYEGFSMPALEAMAAGVPLVATTGGALPEVTGRDGEAAVLVPPADPGALAAAMGELLDNNEMKRRLGHAARDRASTHFSWRNTAKATVEEYTRARAC